MATKDSTESIIDPELISEHREKFKARTLLHAVSIIDKCKAVCYRKITTGE